jgi:hypothetical protein
MKRQTKIIIGAAAIITLTALFFISSLKDKMMKTGKKTIALLGGLDNRANDKNIDQQAELVKKENPDVKVAAFRYNDLSGIQKYIDSNPDSKIILFSAGCRYSSQIAEQMIKLNKDLSDLFIVEPYHSGGGTTKSVKKAVELGVPSKNVYVGSSSSTGKGIVQNTSSTPKCSPSHWCALTKIGKLV